MLKCLDMIDVRLNQTGARAMTTGAYYIYCPTLLTLYFSRPTNARSSHEDILEGRTC